MYASPLRYPGGKRRLAGFVKLILEANDLVGAEYAEVYAGGAGIALELLYEEYASRIHINDLDPTVHAFWLAARDHADDLCRRVTSARLTIDEWKRQRAVFSSANPDPIDLGFATLYLNRTNRSGILTGGPIGGYHQSGPWRLDARFRRDDLVRRIEKVGRFASRIEIYGLDALEFLSGAVRTLPARSMLYLDPPYFVKGQEHLYVNAYRPEDHAAVADALAGAQRPWLVTYDDAAEIRELYAQRSLIAYGIRYTAHTSYRGREVAFFSEGLAVPDVDDPAKHLGATRRPRVAAGA